MAKQIKHNVPNEIQLFLSLIIIAVTLMTTRRAVFFLCVPAERVGSSTRRRKSISFAAPYSHTHTHRGTHTQTYSVREQTGPPNYSKSHYDAASTTVVGRLGHRKLAATRYRVDTTTRRNWMEIARLMFFLPFLFMIILFVFSVFMFSFFVFISSRVFFFGFVSVSSPISWLTIAGQITIHE